MMSIGENEMLMEILFTNTSCCSFMKWEKYFSVVSREKFTENIPSHLFPSLCRVALAFNEKNFSCKQWTRQNYSVSEKQNPWGHKVALSSDSRFYIENIFVMEPNRFSRADEVDDNFFYPSNPKKNFFIEGISCKTRCLLADADVVKWFIIRAIWTQTRWFTEVWVCRLFRRSIHHRACNLRRIFFLSFNETRKIFFHHWQYALRIIWKYKQDEKALCEFSFFLLQVALVQQHHDMSIDMAKLMCIYSAEGEKKLLMFDEESLLHFNKITLKIVCLTCLTRARSWRHTFNLSTFIVERKNCLINNGWDMIRLSFSFMCHVDHTQTNKWNIELCGNRNNVGKYVALFVKYDTVAAIVGIWIERKT
jgi:hypothetical protein